MSKDFHSFLNWLHIKFETKSSEARLELNMRKNEWGNTFVFFKLLDQTTVWHLLVLLCPLNLKKQVNAKQVWSSVADFVEGRKLWDITGGSNEKTSARKQCPISFRGSPKLVFPGFNTIYICEVSALWRPQTLFLWNHVKGIVY